MGSVFKRADSRFWWVAFVGANGERRLVSSKTEDEQAARKLLASIERKVRAEKESGIPTLGPITVQAYARMWIEERRGRGVGSAGDDEARLRHALRRIGTMVLAEVRPRHLVDMVRDIEREGKLAPRSVLHVYNTLRVMFSDALTRELIAATPCILKQRRGELPKKRDKNPEWRPSAIFERQEIEALISDPRLPWRRRVLYAIQFLCGVRVNEVTPRRWSDYDTAAQPLGRLVFATSYNLKKKTLKAPKTGNARQVPVHPTLARVLAEWKLRGWEETYGRKPKPDDLIVPAPGGGLLSSTSELKRLHESLELLGLRRRRQHDCRRTFMTLGQVDDARREVLEVITHDPKGDITSLYTSFPWPTLCAEVAKLNVHLLEGRVLPIAASGAVATAVLRQTEVTAMTEETTWRRRESKTHSQRSLASPGITTASNSEGGGESSARHRSAQDEHRSKRSNRDYEDLAEDAGFRVLPPRGGR